MVMRIVVPAAGSARALADRLGTTYGTERVSISGDRAEIAVQVASASDGAVIRIVTSVERWLAQAGIASAELWLDEHAYRLARWVPAGAPALRVRTRSAPTPPSAFLARQRRRPAARRALAKRRVWVPA